MGVTFASVQPQQLTAGDQLVRVAFKDLPAGSWVVVATVTSSLPNNQDGDMVRDFRCELHSPSGFMGSATDRRVIPEGQLVKRSLTVTGGAFLPQGGRITLFCASQAGAGERVDGGLLMITQIDGFF